jgi:hypothetical protein
MIARIDLEYEHMIDARSAPAVGVQADKKYMYDNKKAAAV